MRLSYATSIDIIKKKLLSLPGFLPDVIATHPERKHQSGSGWRDPLMKPSGQCSGIHWLRFARLGMTESWARSPSSSTRTCHCMLSGAPIFSRRNCFSRPSAHSSLTVAANDAAVPLRRGIRFHISSLVSPTLCAMLSDPSSVQSLSPAFDRLGGLLECECDCNQADKRVFALSEFYRDFFAETRRTFAEEWNCDPARRFSATSWNRRRGNNG